MGNVLPLAGASLFAFAWGRLLYYLDERSKLTMWFVFRMLSYSRLTLAEAKSLFLTVSYLAFGILGALAFAAAGHVDLRRLLAVELRFAPFLLLGVVAEVSLSSLLVGLYGGLLHREDAAFYRHIDSIPWIEGINRLPATWRPLAPFASAVCEEFFFRGVLLTAFTGAFRLRPALALALVTALFVLQQGLQLRTRPQLVVISLGSLSISVVGGILVFATGSVVPAALSHAAFVVFYLQRGERSARSVPSSLE